MAIEGDTHISQLVEHVIHIPAAPELLLSILEVSHSNSSPTNIAVRRGCDVDQPRNLAKSVTVEETYGISNLLFRWFLSWYAPL
jgi:glucosamine--fructose-6-phosphate aminotransferase (isomerizing)